MTLIERCYAATDVLSICYRFSNRPFPFHSQMNFASSRLSQSPASKTTNAMNASVCGWGKKGTWSISIVAGAWLQQAMYLYVRMCCGYTFVEERFWLNVLFKKKKTKKKHGRAVMPPSAEAAGATSKRGILFKLARPFHDILSSRMSHVRYIYIQYTTKGSWERRFFSEAQSTFVTVGCCAYTGQERNGNSSWRSFCAVLSDCSLACGQTTS